MENVWLLGFGQYSCLERSAPSSRPLDHRIIVPFTDAHQTLVHAHRLVPIKLVGITKLDVAAFIIRRRVRQVLWMRRRLDDTLEAMTEQNVAEMLVEMMTSD